MPTPESAPPPELGTLLPANDPVDPGRVLKFRDVAVQDPDATVHDVDPAGDNTRVGTKK